MSDTVGSPVVAVPQSWYRHLGIDPDDDLWTIPSARGRTYVRFKPIRRNWGDVLTDRVKYAALAYFENRSADTVANAINFLSLMARDVFVDGTISAAALMDYRSRLAAEDLHYLGHVAAFLKFWVERGYPGIDRDVLHFFKSVKIPGNVKGAAVRTHHPTKGPFTDAELQGILLTTREACRVGRVTKQDFAILLTLSATGARPGQVSMLVCGDLLPPERGTSTMRLLVPSLKKRTRERLTRERPIPDELAALLGELVEERRRDARFPGIPVEDRPIFATAHPAYELLEDAHVGRDGIKYALRRIQKTIDLRSERTGAPVVLSPRRFRATLGTRAAEAGYPPVVIADLLDHTDLQHVGVYVETRPSIVGRIDAALHGLLEPLAGLFTGTVVADESASGVAEAPSRRVMADSGGNVGTCGGPRSCTRLAPLACYTCSAFRPWRDAPHEELLESLLDERETLLADGVAPQVANANDATMMAIAEVAERCRQAREAQPDA